MAYQLSRFLPLASKRGKPFSVSKQSFDARSRVLQTRTKFDPKADFPLVLPIKDHARNWTQVEVWTIKRHEDPFHGIYDEEMGASTLRC